MNPILGLATRENADVLRKPISKTLLGFPPVGQRPIALPLGLVANWSSSDIEPQTNNALLSTWRDSISGIEAFQPQPNSRPAYRTNRLGGLPSVRFGGSKWLTINSPGAVKTAIDSQIYTVVIVSNNPGASTVGCLFGSSAGGGSQLYFSDGSYAGRFTGGSAAQLAPWSSSSMLCLGYTSTKPYLLGSGTGLERGYINGGCVSSSVAPGPVGSGVRGTFAIGAISAAGTLSVVADIFEVMVWNRALTPAEMVKVQKFVCTKYNQTLPWAGSKFYVFDGDSITAGIGASAQGVVGSYPYKAAQSLSLNYGQWSITAVGGMALNNMPTKAIGEIAEIPALVGVPMRVAAFEYYNVRGGPAAIIAGYAADYATAVRALPDTKLIWGTSTGHSGDPDAVRDAYNALIVASPSTYGDVIVSIHDDTNIGVTGAYAANSATYWADVVHLNNAGYGVLAPLMKAGIDSAG